MTLAKFTKTLKEPTFEEKTAKLNIINFSKSWSKLLKDQFTTMRIGKKFDLQNKIVHITVKNRYYCTCKVYRLLRAPIAWIPSKLLREDISCASTDLKVIKRTFLKIMNKLNHWYVYQNDVIDEDTDITILFLEKIEHAVPEAFAYEKKAKITIKNDIMDEELEAAFEISEILQDEFDEEEFFGSMSEEQYDNFYNTGQTSDPEEFVPYQKKQSSLSEARPKKTGVNN